MSNGSSGVATVEKIVAEAPSTNHKVLSPREKFALVRKELDAALIERTWEVTLCLTALVAKEHALLIGPAGAGKSLLGDALVDWIDGPTFSTLLHRQMPIDELMGMIDVKKFTESNIYERNPENRLPLAVVASLDEIWNSSPVGVTPLMKVANERKYEVAGHWVKSPLHTIIALSNQWPPDNDSGIDIGPLFDRFLLRSEVSYIKTKTGKRKLWSIPVTGKATECKDHTPKISQKITPEELLQANAESRAITWTQEAADAFEKIVHELSVAGIDPGDRREAKAIPIVNAYAYLNGHDEVQVEDLEILKCVLWDDHREQPKTCAKIVSRLANPFGTLVADFEREIEQITENVDMTDLSKCKEATAKLTAIADKVRKTIETLDRSKNKEKLERILPVLESCTEAIVKIRIGSLK